MRRALDLARLRALMKELSQSASSASSVFILGGASAVHFGWRDSTIDADLYSDQQEVFRDIQAIKERLGVNIELVRPEEFVPPLADSESRHILIETIGRVTFFHYDPYAQAFSKIVRGFRQDLLDAENFLSTSMVDGERLRALVHGIPAEAYARYPALSPAAVIEAVDAFLDERE